LSELCSETWSKYFSDIFSGIFSGKLGNELLPFEAGGNGPSNCGCGGVFPREENNGAGMMEECLISLVVVLIASPDATTGSSIRAGGATGSGVGGFACGATGASLVGCTGGIAMPCAEERSGEAEADAFALAIEPGPL
jgi:hypothetical protein